MRLSQFSALCNFEHVDRGWLVGRKSEQLMEKGDGLSLITHNQGGTNDTPSDRLLPPAQPLDKNTRWRLSACPRPTRRRSVTLEPLGSSSVQSAPHLPAQFGIVSVRRAASSESARTSCATGSKTETSSSLCVCLRHTSTLSRLKADRLIRRGASLGLTTARGRSLSRRLPPLRPGLPCVRMSPRRVW